MLNIKKVSLACLGILGVFSFTSCSKKIDKNASYTDITSKLTLSKDYTDKNFVDDGIGLATLSKLTDGDTTTFNMNSKSEVANKTNISVRYHGINTPESTINVEKWGKAASLYTANRLQNAYEIVLEATNTPAEMDSNRTRYLGYVWYRNSESDTFKNLNLELVENGLAEITSTTPTYASIFKEAENFARKYELRLWGNDEDPLFKDETVKATVKDIVTDLSSKSPEVFYDTELEIGAKVEVDAFISEHTVTKSGSNYYTISQIDEDGKKYDFTVFAGYSSSSVNDILNVGYLVHFIGSIQKYNGNFQLAGLIYTISAPENEKCHVITKNYYQFFDSNHERLKLAKETAIQSDLTVTSATVDNNVLTIVGQAKETTTSTETKEFILKVNVTPGYDVSKLVGKSVKAEGLTNTDGSIQVVLENLIIR